MALTIVSVFFVYFVSLNTIYLFLLFLSARAGIVRRLQARYTDFHLLAGSPLTVPVSIVIPVYNEEVGVLDCVWSALGVTFPEHEVIVVNDGSEDRTLELLDRTFSLRPVDRFYVHHLPSRPIKRIYRSATNPNLWVIDKINGGKADALNAGCNMARYRYVATTDGDSIFAQDGLLRLIRQVNVDPGRIVGIGGQIRVGNGINVNLGRVEKIGIPKNFVAAIQIPEYLSSLLAMRTGWSELNSVVVISGAFGLWRKDAVYELGGFTSDTTHEDIEFTYRLHSHFLKKGEPYAVVFMPDPVVWTEVPDNWRSLYRQRKRWQRVVDEVSYIYRHMLFRPRYGWVGMLAFPYMVVYEVFGPFLEVAAYLFTFYLLIVRPLDTDIIVAFLIFSFGLSTLVTISGLLVEQASFRTYQLRALPLLFGLAILINLGYRQYISLARIAAAKDFLAGKKDWQRVPRHGLTQPAGR